MQLMSMIRQYVEASKTSNVDDLVNWDFANRIVDDSESRQANIRKSRREMHAHLDDTPFEFLPESRREAFLKYYHGEITQVKRNGYSNWKRKHESNVVEVRCSICKEKRKIFGDVYRWTCSRGHVNLERRQVYNRRGRR